MTSAETTAALKRRAREAGFDRVAVASAGRLARDGATLQRWLDAGQQAGMGYMEREPAKRADPRLLLPGCRSVVVVGMNYLHSGDPPPAPGEARVARYARGRDYHKVMGKRLRRLSEWLEESTGAAGRSFVDTGPVLERAWLERAGVGWIGKNANLITRSLGSWLLLGELLTEALLEPDDEPHRDFCGSCNACIEACPTDAIVADGVVDSNRCISYWTIEHRGSVPEERRAGNDDWIFGCDVCQDVCPWNRRFGSPRTDDPFEHRRDLAALDPWEILEMDEATFRARYSGTPLMRAKWEGMRRNACIVLGNRGGESDRARLLRIAEVDPDPVVREHASWAGARIAHRR